MLLAARGERGEEVRARAAATPGDRLARHQAGGRRDQDVRLSAVPSHRMAAFRPASSLFEKKQLRPKKLGPPDVYPQEAKQREVSVQDLEEGGD